MKKLVITLLTSALFYSAVADARVYVGQGYGATPERARSAAQAALSETLWVEIKSELSSVTSSDGQQQARQQLSAYSELPLLGADNDCVSKPSGDYYCESMLDSAQAIPRYQAKMKSLAEKIENLLNVIDRKHDDRIKHRLLSNIVLNYHRYQQLQRVMLLLDPTNKNRLSLDISGIQQRLIELEQVVGDLEIAARSITRHLPAQIFFVMPAVPQGSSQATQFGQVMRDRLQDLVRSVQHAEQAELILKGHYQQVKDGIILTYQAYDKNGVIVSSPVVRLASSAYQGLDIAPSGIDFENLLNQGYVVSSDFRADLSSNRGRENLLFETGDEIELFVKLNQPGYFYIVSHNAQENFSYLLELNAAPGRRAFVSYVNADDANRWISLGRFEVVPPHGTEHLQLIASNVDLVDKLPLTRYDSAQQLYILATESSQDAVIQTRALKPKRKQQQRSAESALTYTTMVKSPK